MVESIVNMRELSKPATVLVEKISEAVGGLYKPFQIVRVAKAEAEAERIRTESQIQITDIHRRAMHRFLEEEAQKQLNMEGITQKALPLVKEEANPQKVEKDWISNFFDKCRIVSDEDMQTIWSRILAGEANSPGTFSKRTINLLADLEKSDAELFTNLCGFICEIDNDKYPLIFDLDNHIYIENGIKFSRLQHLENLGLAKVLKSYGSTFTATDLSRRTTVKYYGTMLQLILPKDVANDISVGKVLLTKAGQEIASVCASKPINGFYEHIYDRWAAAGYVPRTSEKHYRQAIPIDEL